MSIFVIVLSVYAVNVCVHADLSVHCPSSGVKGGGKKPQKDNGKSKGRTTHLNASSGLYYQEGCFSWPAPSSENQVD